MSMSDPLADMLTRIRNAAAVGFETVSMPLSKLKVNVARVLKDEGYIRDYHIIKGSTVQGTVTIDLKYGANGEKVVSGIRRVSKPGRRIYVGSESIPTVMSGLGITIMSTSKGVVTDREAKRQRLGGEVLCEVW